MPDTDDARNNIQTYEKTFAAYDECMVGTGCIRECETLIANTNCELELSISHPPLRTQEQLCTHAQKPAPDY